MDELDLIDELSQDITWDDDTLVQDDTELFDDELYINDIEED